MRISVKADTKKLTKDLKLLQKVDVPKATALALNFIAWDVIQAEYRTMQHVFDKPTRWILNSLELEGGRNKGKARPGKLYANIVPKKRTGGYLEVHVKGGLRSKKRSENQAGSYYTPSKYTRLNKHGNLPPSRIFKALADAGLAEDPGQRTKNKQKKYFFGFTKRSNQAVIFEHYGSVDEYGTKRAKPFLILGKPPRYRKRFPFYAVANRIIIEKYERTFNRVFAKFASGKYK